MSTVWVASHHELGEGYQSCTHKNGGLVVPLCSHRFTLVSGRSLFDEFSPGSTNDATGAYGHIPPVLYTGDHQRLTPCFLAGNGNLKENHNK